MLRKLSDGQRRNIAHWTMEFIVVVIGVLLALWLQETVARANGIKTMRAAEAAIRAELDDNLMILVAHQAVDQCLGNRIDEIEARLESAKRAEPITRHPLMKPRPNRPAGRAAIVYAFFDMRVQETAWNSALASGALSQMDRAKFAKLAEIYGMYRMVDRALVTEIDAASTLQVLAYGTELSPELRAQLITAMTVASRDRQFLGSAMSPQFMAGEIRKLGWNDRAAMATRIRDFIKSMHGYGVYLQDCARPFANPFPA